MQTFVEVRTDRHELIDVGPNQRTLKNHSCLAAHGAAYVAPYKAFKILVSSFGDEPKTIFKGQTVASVKPHFTFIEESDIS